MPNAPLRPDAVTLPPASDRRASDGSDELGIQGGEPIDETLPGVPASPRGLRAHGVELDNDRLNHAVQFAPPFCRAGYGQPGDDPLQVHGQPHRTLRCDACFRVGIDGRWRIAARFAESQGAEPLVKDIEHVRLAELDAKTRRPGAFCVVALEPPITLARFPEPVSGWTDPQAPAIRDVGLSSISRFGDLTSAEPRDPNPEL